MSSKLLESVFERCRGTTPLIISLPHVGTELPLDVARRMTPAGRGVPDTDWHVQHLYGFAREAGASWLQARLSRYVIDLNRPPDDQSLYPGQTTTSLCPTLSFAGDALYRGATPAAREIARRRRIYWYPYHVALRELIDEVRREFGYAVLLDAHSIRSQHPRLFPGRLPDVNVGTNEGSSCSPSLTQSVEAALKQQTRFTHVVNGRFKGGYITRSYGEPQSSVHAIQLELAQAAYMDEVPTTFDADRAAPLVFLLRQIVAQLFEFKSRP